MPASASASAPGSDANASRADQTRRPRARPRSPWASMSLDRRASRSPCRRPRPGPRGPRRRAARPRAAEVAQVVAAAPDRGDEDERGPAHGSNVAPAGSSALRSRDAGLPGVARGARRRLARARTGGRRAAGRPRGRRPRERRPRRRRPPRRPRERRPGPRGGCAALRPRLGPARAQRVRPADPDRVDRGLRQHRRRRPS